MELLESPYLKVLKFKNEAIDIFPICEPNLGLSKLEHTRNLGSSSSGMILAKSEINGKPVFVKIFPMTCNWKKFKRSNGEIIKIKKDIKFDKDAMEIGLTHYISDLLFLKIPFTQNLVAFYLFNTCEYAYESEKSECSCKVIDKFNQDTVVYKDKGGYPHDSLMDRYINGELDDKLSFMIIENCSGDLEKYLEKIFKDYGNDEINEIYFSKLMNSIFIQIILTIKCLNSIFNPYFHSDLGPRNILVTMLTEKLYKDRTYFKYIINDIEYNVENMNVIPKLWDFSNVKLDERQSEQFRKSDYFSYLRPEDEYKTCTTEIIPNISQLCESIIKIPQFEYVKDTIFARKILLIIENHEDYFDDYIELFNLFEPNETQILLEPVFLFNDDIQL
jgi:hypothetical protein